MPHPAKRASGAGTSSQEKVEGLGHMDSHGAPASVVDTGLSRPGFGVRDPTKERGRVESELPWKIQ